MIVITGATGKLGTQIVQQLLERIPAEQVGVSVRNPDNATDLAARGVRVRRGDFTEPASLVAAFEGAAKVLIVSANAQGADAFTQNKAAIDAARNAGAQRVFYTSHQGANPDSYFKPMTVHAATEKYLSETGTPYTALRHGFYASTMQFLLGHAFQTGEISAPADGPVSWTTHADLAEAAANLLTGHDHIEGPTAPLTASSAYDLADTATMLTEITGRSIKRVIVDDETWTSGMLNRGIPEQQATLLLGMFHAMRRHEFIVTDPTLERLLGRKTTPLYTTLETLATT